LSGITGEKIDIIPWSDDAAALSAMRWLRRRFPRFIINQKPDRWKWVVEDDQLSLAIGRRGQNVRLAAKLTEWRMNPQRIQDGAGLPALDEIAPEEWMEGRPGCRGGEKQPNAQ